jgi:positive regulator of sigma E activity
MWYEQDNVSDAALDYINPMLELIGVAIAALVELPIFRFLLAVSVLAVGYALVRYTLATVKTKL